MRDVDEHLDAVPPVDPRRVIYVPPPVVDPVPHPPIGGMVPPAAVPARPEDDPLQVIRVACREHMHLVEVHLRQALEILAREDEVPTTVRVSQARRLWSMAEAEYVSSQRLVFHFSEMTMDHPELQDRGFRVMVQQHTDVYVNLLLQVATGVSRAEAGLDLKTVDLQPERVRCKLPELTLPKYAGDVDGFASFMQMFDAVVGNRTDIGDVVKFTYLQGCLSDEAYLTVKHIFPSDINYHLMRKALAERFNYDFLERDRMLKAFLEIQSLGPAKSTSELRALYHRVQREVATLATAGVNIMDHAPVVIPMLLKVMPERVRRKLLRKDDGDRTVQTLLNIAKKMLREEEGLALYNAKEPGSKPSEPREAAKETSGSSRRESRRPEAVYQVETRSDTCIFCNKKGHPFWRCETVSDPAARKNAVYQQRRCYGCLGVGHSIAKCSSKHKVCTKCKGSHNRAICMSRGGPPRAGYPSRRGGEGHGGSNEPSPGLNCEAIPFAPPAVNAVVNLAASARPVIADTVFLQTARVRVVNPDTGQTEVARFLLDTGATCSFITQDLRRKLGLQPAKTGSLTLNTVGAPGGRSLEYAQVRIRLLGSNYSRDAEVYATDNVCTSVGAARLSRAAWGELMGVRLSDHDAVMKGSLPVDGLIGADLYYDIVLSGRRQLTFGPTLVETRFGWVMGGPSHDRRARPSHNISANVYHLTVSVFAGLDSPRAKVVRRGEDVPVELTDLWEIEGLGIREDEVCPVDQFFQDTVAYDKDELRYTVALPWKQGRRERLPDHSRLCWKRWASLCTRLLKVGNESLREKYDAVISGQLKSDVIEVAEPQLGLVHFMPHQPVVKPTTGSLRVVNDGSAEEGNGGSLNQAMHTGPSLIADLAQVLLRFRLHSVPVVADIEKAFLQINLLETDRDALRFYYGPSEAETSQFRFRRLPFGLNSAPYLLNAVIRKHLSDQPATDTIQLLQKSFYVDDLITGVETVDAARRFTVESVEVMRLAGMRLTGWKTSSTELVAALPESFKTDDDGQSKVLGLSWDRRADTLAIGVKDILSEPMKPTLRNLLRVVASVYDPLGLVSPVMLEGKLLFQQATLLGLSWDQKLPDEIAKPWEAWRQKLPDLEQFTLPRYVLGVERLDVTIHGFADASSKAYALSIYVVVAGESHLVFAKQRVAPARKKRSIPRLELMGVWLLARAVPIVEASLEGKRIHKIRMYTDSMNVLYWISSDHTIWSPFVGNRVKDILQLTPADACSHVRTEENPADIPTRGMSAEALRDCDLWKSGPEFIRCPGREPETVNVQATEECMAEKRKTVAAVVRVLSRAVTRIMTIERYSSWTRVRRITQTLFTACARLLNFEDYEPEERSAEALEVWIRAVQADEFHEELKYLRLHPLGRGEDDRCPPTRVTQMNLFVDEVGRIRARSRLQNSSLSYDASNPILLPNNHLFTRLLVKDTHERHMHMGTEQILANMRETYWIPTGRKLVRGIVRSCHACKRQKAVCYPIPPPPPLPEIRLWERPPFTITGIDYAGPFHTNNKKKQSFVLLLTCAVTRAVHLELTESQNITDTVLAFRRFVARRGRPHWIISDNGGSFCSMGQQFNAYTQIQRLQERLEDEPMKWTHYLSRSPWWGGFIERMVSTVKSTLKRVVGETSCTVTELQTIFAEIEAIVNSRPIAHTTAGLDEPLPITPQILMNGQRTLKLPPLDTVKSRRQDRGVVQKRLRYLEKLKQEFWKSWQEQYLNSLKEQHIRNVTHQNPHQVFPKVGDIVMVLDKTHIITTWVIGRIVQVIPGVDDVVRTCKVRVAKRDPRDDGYLMRSPRHLVPLEMGVAPDVDIPEGGEESGEHFGRGEPGKAASPRGVKRKKRVDSRPLSARRIDLPEQPETAEEASPGKAQARVLRTRTVGEGVGASEFGQKV